MEKYKFHFRCQTCAEDCTHEYSMKIIADEEGFWVGTGPYTVEEAEGVIKKAQEMIEARNNKNQS